MKKVFSNAKNGLFSVYEPVTLTSDVKQRKQRSQHNRPNPNNRYKTKKNFTGFYTEVNPKKCFKKDPRELHPREFFHVYIINK